MQSEITDLSTLQITLSYLMTRYARTGSPQVAGAVIHHLSMILAHPNTPADSNLAETYRALLRQWRELEPRSHQQTIQSQNATVFH